MAEPHSALLDLMPRLAAGDTLARADARRAMDAVVSGAEPPSRIGALLAVLKLRGPAADEIAGFADSLLAQAVAFPLPAEPCVDTCGTGGDGKLTFNISTVAALVVAACGVSVVKHGNRSSSGRCGSADLLERLGVAIEGPPARMQRQLAETRFAFLFAPSYHPVLKQLASLRREIGFPTVFNLLGPLLNPAGVRRQLLGVFDASLQRLMAAALALRGSEHAYVVHGEGGFDEATPCGPAHVIEVAHGALRDWTLDPRSLGIDPCPEDELQAASADASAAHALEVLAGRPSPRTDAVLLNAGLALHVAGAVATIAAGIALARGAIGDRRARRLLERLQQLRREDA